MSSKESALLALMQEEGYTMGIINLTLHVLDDEKEALDEMILYIDDNHPNEDDFIDHLAEVCADMGIEM